MFQLNCVYLLCVTTSKVTHPLYTATWQHLQVLDVMINLHNYCSDDIDINMKWYILSQAHLSRFQAVLTIIYLAKRLESYVRVMLGYGQVTSSYGQVKVRLGNVRFGSVRFGYISFLYLTQKLSISAQIFFPNSHIQPIFTYNNEHCLKPSQMC